jgi:hypothetical protein
MSDMRNRPEQAAALILFAQPANPIPLGVAGFWFDGATVIYVDTAGNQAAIGGSPINYGVVGDIKPVAASASAGVLDKAARADHAHAGLPVTYGAVGEVAPVGIAAAAGVLDKTARADHAHALTYGAVGELAPVGTASAGVINKAARIDHGHALAVTFGAVTDIAPVGAAASAGVLDSFARADHAHALAADGALLSVVPNASSMAGIPMIRRITIPTGANGNTDVTLLRKERVIEAWLIMAAGGVPGASLVVRNGTQAITNNVDLSARASRDVVRFGNIDPARQDIADGGTLRASRASTGGSFPGCELYVLTVAVP